MAREGVFAHLRRIETGSDVRAVDLLQNHSGQVEEAIFFQTASLLDLEADLVFYDTTTMIFSIDTEDEEATEGEGTEESCDPLR